MRLRQCFHVSLIVSLAVSVAHAQRPLPALAEAERALADALIRHDRSAFVSLFAPDAESTLPSVKRGPDAIADSWLPFLVDPGTTMILTNTGVVTAASGDAGTTTGTFAIRGRTNEGMRTMPGGAYEIRWRVIDGRWKIITLSGGGRGTRTAADAGGVGPYRFGMTRIEVSQIAGCQPYTTVAATGGLECAHYLFEGREMNISFLFSADRLRRIQLWFYEGDSGDEAHDAVGRVLDHLQRIAGGGVVRALPKMTVTADGVMRQLNSTPAQAGRIAQIEITTPPGPQPEIWFSRVVAVRLATW